MASTMLFALAAALAVSLTHASPMLEGRHELSCGDRLYDTSKYICYTNSSGDETLCPIINGLATSLCGSACYSSFMYSCRANMLRLLPTTTSAFTLIASNPDAPFDGKTIEAAGEHLYIGASPATYCPVSPAICSQFPNITILFYGGLFVTVPGGQATYWQDDGALAFTIAHSGAEYNVSGYASTVYEGGGYYGPNNEQLIACPATGETGVWQVFAQLAGLEFGLDCIGFYAVVQARDSSESGAWEFT